MKQHLIKIKQASIKKQKSVQDLLKDNPEVALAHQIMDQARKTQKPAVTINQTNSYKISSEPFTLKL